MACNAHGRYITGVLSSNRSSQAPSNSACWAVRKQDGRRTGPSNPFVVIFMLGGVTIWWLAMLGPKSQIGSASVLAATHAGVARVVSHRSRRYGGR
eukprot:3383633-Amphidinium_carterae.1